jgi:hypothetical protein
MSSKQRNKFNFFLSYYEIYKILDREQREILMDYIFKSQFENKDLDDLPTKDPMFRAVLEGIKPNLQASINGYRDATRGVAIQKADKAMQDGMNDGTQGEKLIDAFTFKYLASDIDLFDALYKEFKDNGKDPEHEENYNLWLASFRDKMHNRTSGWNKSVKGINALFDRYINEKWIDLEKLDLKEDNNG